jgi:putative transposase
MANSYTQIHIHFIFVVKYRERTIQNIWRDNLYKYITGIVQTQKHKLLAINGMPDHIHLLIGMRPHQSVSELIQDIKGSSSKWINDQKLVIGKFEWQAGYGAFSYASSQINDVIHYINNQQKHHHHVTFHEEYILFLQKFKVDYDERYFFKELI